MVFTEVPQPTVGAHAAAPVTGTHAPGHSRGPLIRRAAIALLASLAVLWLCVHVALHTETGQRLDEAAMWAISGPAGTLRHVHEILGTISVATVALALGCCEVLALLRRRWAVALAVPVLVIGANATTQILKHEVLTRTDYGMGTINALPSGHTTVMVSLALAAVLVAPAALRSVVALLGAAAATLVGVGTVVARWHRPGDVLAAVAVCVAWTALALLVVAVAGRRPAPRRTARGGGSAGLALLGAVTVGVVLVAAGLRPSSGLPTSFGLAVASLSAIGLACAIAVGWTARVAARSLR